MIVIISLSGIFVCDQGERSIYKDSRLLFRGNTYLKVPSIIEGKDVHQASFVKAQAVYKNITINMKGHQFNCFHVLNE